MFIVMFMVMVMKINPFEYKEMNRENVTLNSSGNSNVVE